MSTIQSMGNSHCFYASYVCPTAHRGSRIKVWNYDLSRKIGSLEKPMTKILSYDYEFSDSLEQVLMSLVRAGIKIESYNARNPAFYTIHCEWETDGISADKVRAYFAKGVKK